LTSYNLGRRFGPRPRLAGLAQPWNRLASPCQWHDTRTRTCRLPRAMRWWWRVGCRRLRWWGVGRPVARAPWVHNECTKHGEWQRDSPNTENGGATHRTRRQKWAPEAVFPVMAVCFGGHRWQRKGPRAPEEIEGRETQLQCGREDQVGGAYREGWVGGGSSWNLVSSAVGNGEQDSRRWGEVAKVVRGLWREEPSAEDGGRKVMVFDGFFAPWQRGENGGEGAWARRAAKREGRGLVRCARARGAVCRPSRCTTRGGRGQSARHVSRGGGSPACGPHLETMDRPGKKGNGPVPRRIVPSSTYLKISKRFELIWSKCVLLEF
jgi:hypothetical protein